MPHYIRNTETEWPPVHSHLASFTCFHCLPALWALDFVAVCTELMIIIPYIQNTFTYVDPYHLEEVRAGNYCAHFLDGEIEAER